MKTKNQFQMLLSAVFKKMRVKIKNMDTMNMKITFLKPLKLT